MAQIPFTMRLMVALVISKLMQALVLKQNVCSPSIRVAINSVGQITLNIKPERAFIYRIKHEN